MRSNKNLRYKITIFWKKTGNTFEVYMAPTRKECEKVVKDRKLEMKNWADEEPRPTGICRSWVIV